MNYQETIDYLYQLLPVFHREGKKAYKADLKNTLAICEHLGNPQQKFKSIHVGVPMEKEVLLIFWHQFYKKQDTKQVFIPHHI
jgi:hypothetical protein